MISTRILALAVAFTVSACGATQMQSTDSFDSGQAEQPQGSDATKAKAKPKAAPEQQAGSQADAVECGGVAVHGEVGAEACDSDDVAVADNKVPTVEQPAEEPAKEEPKKEDPKPEEPAKKPDEPAKPDTTQPKDPNIVEFRIKAGTAKQPWNTAATMVEVKVGQTLRIFNDDTVTHRLHTGGAPCPHGANFAPGASYDCVVTKALDPAKTAGATYDHIAGPTALFYLKANP